MGTNCWGEWRGCCWALVSLHTLAGWLDSTRLNPRLGETREGIHASVPSAEDGGLAGSGDMGTLGPVELRDVCLRLGRPAEVGQ